MKTYLFCRKNSCQLNLSYIEIDSEIGFGWDTIMDTNPYDNVYLDREGIVKPIPTSPAKSNEIQGKGETLKLKHTLKSY